MAFQISRVGQPWLATKNQLNFLNRLQKPFLFSSMKLYNHNHSIVRFTEAPAESDFPRKFKVIRV
jgi:hypothetical protein